jgi:hypothetical protein
MSKLYLSESGHVVPTLCEELTTFRRARKLLDLPATRAAGTVYILARPAAGSTLPLRVAINGAELPPIAPKSSGAYFWYDLSVDASLLLPGTNRFEFRTDSTAMNAWSLAIEPGHAQPGSAVSDDGGATWRGEKMGYLNVLRGEYVVRVRLAEGEDPPPPAMVWEDAAHPRVRRLREVMPAQALQPGPLIDRVRALTGWLSSSWEHTGSGRAAQYAPWDAETILAWGRSRSGHNGQLPIVMCVHYGAALVSCCQALGIPARCAVFTGALDGGDGHFAAEVWFSEHEKWVLVDPNMDALFWKDSTPLSVTEIQEAGDDLSPIVEWGPGIEFQRQNPLIADWMKSTYLSGRCFRHRSVWYRADLLSHPELSPPGHGSTAYCETGLVWEKRDLERGLGMFPHFAEAAYFDGPPAGFGGAPVSSPNDGD